MSKDKQGQQDNQRKVHLNKPVQEKMKGMKTAVSTHIPSLQRAYTDPRSLSPGDAKVLQRTIGNQALGQLIIQRKMTVGPVGDKYEQEADAVAKQVVSKLHTSPAQNAPAQTAQRQEEEELQMKPLIQRQEEEELQMKPLPTISSLQRQEEEELQMKTVQRQEEEELQMQPLPSISSLQRQEEEELQAKGDPMLAGGELSGNVESSVQSAKFGGQPMSDNIRTPMEQAFNADFSSVKVHTDSQSDSLNRSLSARAFTSGQDIFFRGGEYNPASSAGKTLLAHELTHTIQQGAAPVQKSADTVSSQVKPNRGQAVLSRKGTHQTKQALVQRAALEDDKLNLVGESHNKNAARRNAERGYGNDEGGGTYWQEKSFRYGTDNRRGDPDHLIIGYRIDRFKRHIDDLAGSYNPRELNGMQRYCRSISNDLNNANKFPHQGQQAPMLSSLVKLKKWTVGLIVSWNGGLNANPDGWQSLINQKMLFIKPEYEQLNKKYEAITKRNSERDAIDARYARSDAMWIGAANGGQTGLWMVGQNHIDDINMLHGQYQTEGTHKKMREKFAEEVKMQDKADFETEFQVWWTANEATYPK